MAYIDPDGMFGGDRMALLSDSAKFAWPWFWCASNTVGRVELNYQAFIDTVFRHFKKQPTETQFWDWVAEFHESYLMYVYEVEGKVWGQWDVSAKYLPTYQTQKDKNTPAPTVREFNDWKDQYLDRKKSKVIGKCRVLNISRKLSESGIDSLNLPLGEERRGEITTTVETFDEALDRVATAIHDRHPHRKCAREIVKSKLLTIVKSSHIDERIDRLNAIDANHVACCASHDWQKENHQYVKGLKAWLNPAEKLFDLPAGPPMTNPALLGPRLVFTDDLLSF